MAQQRGMKRAAKVQKRDQRKERARKAANLKRLEHGHHHHDHDHDHDHDHEHEKKSK